ncbi:MAG TPA: hypothetical protein VIL85_02145 [Thermomicrobiales bacterium]|jgi:hypothetical protein
MAFTPRLLLAQATPATIQTARGATNGWADALRPVDPQTLADLPDYVPIRLGSRHSSALSPDSQTLALLTAPDDPFGPPLADSQRVYTLHLLDLPRWQERQTPVTVTGTIGWFGFATGNARLYWLISTDSDEMAPVQREYTLYRYELGASHAEAVVRLPRGMVGEAWRDLRLLRSGHQLAFYDPVSAMLGRPQLRFLDLASGQFIATLSLAGLRTGATRGASGEETALPGLAWDTMHDRLYIAHADVEQITTVDLGTRAIIRQAEIGDGAPAPTYDLEPYGTVDRTRAVGRGKYRYATLDATGETLIVSGRETITEPLPDGRWQVRDRIEMMRVIATATFRVNGQLPAWSTLVAATERGILLHTTRYVYGYPSLEPGDFQLRLFDPIHLRELWRGDTAPGDIWTSGSSPDGRFVYLMSPNNGGFAPRDGASGRGHNALGVFDLTTRRMTGDRIMPQGGAHLIAVADPGAHRGGTPLVKVIRFNGGAQQ